MQKRLYIPTQFVDATPQIRKIHQKTNRCYRTAKLHQICRRKASIEVNKYLLFRKHLITRSPFLRQPRTLPAHTRGKNPQASSFIYSQQPALLGICVRVCVFSYGRDLDSRLVISSPSPRGWKWGIGVFSVAFENHERFFRRPTALVVGCL